MPSADQPLQCMFDTETLLAAVSFVNRLASGELLTGTPTVLEIRTTDLTLANKAINTAQIVVLEDTVAIGQAVQFSVTGGTGGRAYEIEITVNTDAGVAQTFVERVPLRVIA